MSNSSIWPIERTQSGPEWTWEQWQWRGTLHYLKLQNYWSLTLGLFDVISRTHVMGGLTFLQRCSRCILSPLLTGLFDSCINIKFCIRFWILLFALLIFQQGSLWSSICGLSRIMGKWSLPQRSCIIHVAWVGVSWCIEISLRFIVYDTLLFTHYLFTFSFIPSW